MRVSRVWTRPGTAWAFARSAMRSFGVLRIQNASARVWAVAASWKYATGTKSRISCSHRHAIASVGVFTWPMPITLRAPPQRRRTGARLASNPQPLRGEHVVVVD